MTRFLVRGTIMEPWKAGFHESGAELKITTDITITIYSGTRNIMITNRNYSDQWLRLEIESFRQVSV